MTLLLDPAVGGPLSPDEDIARSACSPPPLLPGVLAYGVREMSVAEARRSRGAAVELLL